MPDHHFDPMLAQKYGIDSAVFLHNIYFWIKYNKAYQKNFYEGRYWTFNSLAAFCEAHPYWSRRQIERIIAACKKNGLLLTGCFNQDKRDRTSWYTLSDKALAYFADTTPEATECISPNSEMEITTETAECISQNGEMETTERGQSFHQTGTALPDINPSNSQTDIPPQAPQGAAAAKDGKAKEGKRDPRIPKYQPDWFESFWKKYPLREGRRSPRSDAVQAWDKLRPSRELCYAMSAALEPKNWPKAWFRDDGRYIPLAATWLNCIRKNGAEYLSLPDKGKRSPLTPPAPEEEVQNGWY